MCVYEFMKIRRDGWMIRRWMDRRMYKKKGAQSLDWFFFRAFGFSDFRLWSESRSCRCCIPLFFLPTYLLISVCGGRTS